MEEFKRFEMLIGKDNLEKLSKKHIAIRMLSSCTFRDWQFHSHR